jgi:hypothetical protein
LISCFGNTGCLCADRQFACKFGRATLQYAESCVFTGSLSK